MKKSSFFCDFLQKKRDFSTKRKTSFKKINGIVIFFSQLLIEKTVPVIFRIFNVGLQHLKDIQEGMKF